MISSTCLPWSRKYSASAMVICAAWRRSNGDSSDVATTTTLATDTSSANNYMPGHYPHPFNINFGFPRKDEGATIGVTIESKGKMLNSTEGILAKWSPNGKIAWVFTSRLATVTPAGTLPATDQKFGGIGYGCVWGTGTDIYTCGPMYSTAPAN